MRCRAASAVPRSQLSSSIYETQTARCSFSSSVGGCVGPVVGTVGGGTESEVAGAGAGEWASGGDVLARELRLLRAMPQVDGFALYASSYLTEETHPGIGDAARYEADVVRSELRELAAALTARES